MSCPEFVHKQGVQAENAQPSTTGSHNSTAVESSPKLGFIKIRVKTHRHDFSGHVHWFNAHKPQTLKYQLFKS